MGFPVFCKWVLLRCSIWRLPQGWHGATFGWVGLWHNQIFNADGVQPGRNPFFSTLDSETVLSQTTVSSAPAAIDPASVEAAVTGRMSVRAFLPQPVSRELIAHVLQVASRAPSGTNTQPWKVYVLQGHSRDSLVDKVCAAHDAIRDNPALAANYQEAYNYYPKEWFSPYIDRRRENGWSLYGLLGITKGDKEKMHAQHQRNYQFFDAPVGLMITIDKKMGEGSLLDTGMFLQNIMLLARAHGLGTCPQAAWNNFGSIVMPHIGAGDNELLVCGMSLGYPDPADKVNTFLTPREPATAFTTWLD